MFGFGEIAARRDHVGAPDPAEQLGVCVPDRRRQGTALRIGFLRGIEFVELAVHPRAAQPRPHGVRGRQLDRKSTRLNSSHGYISYAVFCLKKKKKTLATNSDRRTHSVVKVDDPPTD